ncbi:MAG: hypothetical protein QM765_19110 [Myxococcales bacterium]
MIARILSVGVRRGDALALAIGRAADAPDDGVDLVAGLLGVFQPLEHQRHRALAHDEAVGVGVERPAAVGGERADLGELDEGGRTHRAVDAAGDDRVGLAGHQHADGRLQRRQRRGAGRVGGEVHATQVERVGDAAGDDVAQLTGHRVLGDERQPLAGVGEHPAHQPLLDVRGEPGELRDLAQAADGLGQHGAHRGLLVLLAAERVAQHHRDA